MSAEITDGLHRLCDPARREVSASFHRLVCRLAGEFVPTAEAQDVAGDAICAMSQLRLEGKITTMAGLRRWLRRWHTQCRSPQYLELWKTLSQALRDLEREGVVQRSLASRARHNTNHTSWWLAGHESRRTNRQALEDLRLHLSQPSAKSDRQRILSPNEARQMVAVTLRLADGPLTMGDIFHRIRSQLPVFDDSTSADRSTSAGDDDNGQTIAELAASRSLLDEVNEVEEEVSHRAKRIWQIVSRISSKQTRTGAVIAGRDVFCRYLLPRTGEERAILADLGKLSTVESVKDRICEATRSLFMVERLVPHEHADEIWMRREILTGIILRLRQYCATQGGQGGACSLPSA